MKSNSDKNIVAEMFYTGGEKKYHIEERILDQDIIIGGSVALAMAPLSRCQS